MKIKCDNIELKGCKGSLRMFGVPESTPGTTDDKALTMLNDNVKVSPSLHWITWRSPIEWACLYQFRRPVRAQGACGRNHGLTSKVC